MESNENPSSGRRVVVACGRTDITKPIIVSGNFANSPKNALYCKNDIEYPKFTVWTTCRSSIFKGGGIYNNHSA